MGNRAEFTKYAARAQLGLMGIWVLFAGSYFSLGETTKAILYAVYLYPSWRNYVLITSAQKYVDSPPSTVPSAVYPAVMSALAASSLFATIVDVTLYGGELVLILGLLTLVCTVVYVTESTMHSLLKKRVKPQ